jgi:hypothetical protein
VWWYLAATYRLHHRFEPPDPWTLRTLRSAEGVPRDSIIDLIGQNIVSQEARHLMVLTKNSAALGLLLDNHVLDHEKTQVLFGSDFPLDKTDLQVIY